MGSIGGGGRYDDLTGLFGLKGLSGVGISFGIDRIYDVLEELKAFPEQLAEGTVAMLVNFGGENEIYALHILDQLRAAGIAAEIYPDAAKFDKQMKYANKRAISYPPPRRRRTHPGKSKPEEFHHRPAAIAKCRGVY